ASTLTYGYGNLLTDVDGNSVEWDDYGDIIHDYKAQTFAYDPTGDPAQFDVAANRVSFVRDAVGSPVGAITTSGSAPGERKQIRCNPGGRYWPRAGVNTIGQPVIWAVADGILVGRIENGTVHEPPEDPKGSLLMFDSTLLSESGAFGDTVASTPAV